MDKIKKEILLVTPKSFYLFHHFLANEFENKGFNVTISNDEYPENFVGKVLGKFRFEIGKTITKNKISLDFLQNRKYDLILIINGRGMSIGLIEEMKKVSKLIIGYTFDSFKYHKAPLGWYKSLSHFFTFDIRDSIKYNIPLLELFSSMPGNDSENFTRDIDLSIIARNHSDRLVYLDKVLKAIPFNNLFIYIFEKDVATFVINFLNNPKLYLKYRKFIHFKALDYKLFCKVMKRSVFTLDYAHPDQSGLTMRSFEAAAVGTKMITNNPYIFESVFYSQNDAILFPLNGDKIILYKSYNILKSRPFNLRKRSIQDFVSDILSFL